MSTGNSERRVQLKRRGFLSAVGVGSLATVTSGATGTTASGEETLTIIHDTHFHGRFSDASDPERNIVRYYTMVERLRDKHENTIFLGVGDDIAPSLLGLEFNGKHMIPALNYMEPDAVGVGNHEFDFGASVAENRFWESEFPWVAANLLTDQKEPIPGAERWTTIDVGGVTVGVFGLGSDQFHELTDYPDDWTVLNTVDAATEAVAALDAAGADIIVGALHVSTSQQRTIATEVDGLDAIVGSHAGTVFDEPEVHGDGTILSEFGDEFAHIGRLTFGVESGELVDWERIDFYNAKTETNVPEGTEHITPVNVHDVAEDTWLSDHADTWTNDLEERLGRPFFKSEVELDATFNTNYSRESRWGNLMTDVMREIDGFDIDVAVQNAGGIRSDTTYGPGEITGMDVLNILPFPNEVQVLEVTGDVLHQYLMNAIRPLTDGSSVGAQPAIQVSGIQYEWRGHHGKGEVLDVFVGGNSLDRNKTYTVVSNDYVIGNTVLGEQGKIIGHAGKILGPFVLDRLEERGVVSPSIEGRILRVDEDLGTPREVVRRRGNTMLRFDLPKGVETVSSTNSFFGITGSYERLDPERVTVEGGDLWIVYRTRDLQPFLAKDRDRDLRVFGGFEPTESSYGYTDNGELMDIPVSAGYDTFRLKATIDL